MDYSIIGVVGGNNQSPAQDVNLGATGTRFPYGVSVGFGRGNGCYEIYATSSATAGKLVASTTATIEGVDGVMMFQYGRCLTRALLTLILYRVRDERGSFINKHLK